MIRMNQKEFETKMKKAKKKLGDERLHDVCEACIKSSRGFGENGSRQLYIATEEMAELIQCIQKALRGKIDKTHTVEEMADVIIGLEYVKQVLEIDDDAIYKALNVKLDRIQDEISKAEKSGKPFK